MCKLPQVIIVSGPTASGKSAFAVELAKIINGAIISADSMQVYKGLDIGSAKIIYDEMQQIDHYLIDIINPNIEYSVADFQKEARLLIDKLIKQKKVPIIVGGTGLYIQSLVYDYIFDEFEPLDYERYNQLSLTELGEKLKKKDLESYLKIEKNNRRRITHALALVEQTEKSKSMREQEQENKLLYDIFAIALMPERERLYEKINKRVEIMIQEGLIAEVDYFNQLFQLAPQVKRAIGYRETLDFLEQKIESKKELIECIQQNTRRFAKRQITWIKNQKIDYHCIYEEKEKQEILKNILNFLNE